MGSGIVWAGALAEFCRTYSLRCFTSWHERMFLRGDWNGWGKDRDGAMALVGDYTWATNIDIAGFMRAKFAPGEGWSRAYGAHADRELLYNLPDYDERHKTFDIVPSMSGSEASRRYMAKGGHWSPNEALASGAEFAKELWVGAACTAEAPACPVPEDGAWHCVGFTRPEQNMDWCRAQGTVACVEYAENDKTPAMASCGPCDCCRRKVSPDLSAAARSALPPPTWFREGRAVAFWTPVLSRRLPGCPRPPHRGTQDARGDRRPQLSAQQLVYVASGMGAAKEGRRRMA